MHAVRCSCLLALMLLVGVGCGGSGEEEAGDAGVDSLDTSHGNAMIEGYFEDQVRTIEMQWSERAGDRSAWSSRRTERVRQLREMLGLMPWPERGPLEVTLTDTIRGEGYRVEMLHFQAIPDLYVTANLYVPTDVEGPRPTILYVTGHASEEGPDGQPLGSKTAYQRHPAWYARHGYVALTFDTIQLGEIDGVHHGTYRHGRWWWYNRGYNPLGVEVWNGMRAIDLLEDRPEVDVGRIGVTGRSGGGAYAWFLGAVDERVAVSVPTAGITDLRNYLVDEVLADHCDCMYMLNTYRWDFPTVAALSAPRPVRLVNGDRDPLFPIDGVRRVYRKAREVWSLYDAADRFDLVVEPAAHEDTPAIQHAAFRFMHRHLKGASDSLVLDPDSGAAAPFDPVRLRVFEEVPEEAINQRIDEEFVPVAEAPPVPEASGEADLLVERWMEGLREKTFRGWPAAAAPEPKHVRTVTENGLALSTYRVQTQDAITLKLWRLGAEPERSSKAASSTGGSASSLGDRGDPQPRLAVLDSTGWQDWVGALRAGFGRGTAETAIGAGSEAFFWPEPRSKRFEQLRNRVAAGDTTLFVLAPRGIGPTRWTQDRPGYEIRRGFPLIGQTRDGMRAWDVRQVLRALDSAGGTSGPVDVEASGAMAGVALYGSLFDETNRRLLLRDLPSTHREGPYLLQVRQIMDLPQAVGLAALRGQDVRLLGADRSAWSWPLAIAERPWTSGSVALGAGR